MKYPRTLKPQVEKFLHENEEWIEEQRRAAPTDPYWKQIELLDEQVLAMSRGYAAAAPRGEELSQQDFKIMTLDDDLGAIEEAVVPEMRPKWGKMSGAEIFEALTRREHCSAVVKVAPDLSDLWVAHNIWGSYEHSLRVMKS